MKILFVGNSHTYFNDMPAIFSKFWEVNTGDKPIVTMLAYSARDLAWHNNEYFSLRFNILYGSYDFCIIQQQAHPFPGKDQTLEGLLPILSLCREAGTKPVIVSTWVEKRNPELQESVNSAYLEIAESTGCTLAPVGFIWDTVLQTHPEIDLFWYDGEHASPEGDYLLAMILFRTVFGRNGFSCPEATLDFTKGASIDFRNPRVTEDPSLTGKPLNPGTISALKEAAESFFPASE